MSKRRTHSPEFKARVAMEVISGRKTIREIAADHAVHPIQVREIKALKKKLQRKKKALAEAAALLVLRKKWEAYSLGEAFGYSSEDAEG